MFIAAGHMISEAYLWLMDHLFIINLVFSILIIFFQRRDPTTVWAWLLLLYFLPGLGFILYLVLGQNFHKDRMFKMKEIEGEIKHAVRRQEESIYRRKLKLRDPELERFKSLILYNLNEGEAVLTDNNDIRVYTDGREKFDALLSEMDHARNYIHLQYYIIRNDELWQEIEEVLLRKARQGVEIRVLFDSMGCRGMKNSDWDRLEKAGIQVAEFFPAVLGKLQLRVNYRNHRKIAVIDGRILEESIWEKMRNSDTGEIPTFVSKERRSLRLQSVLHWTGIMQREIIFFWRIICLNCRLISGTGVIRCRSFPADRTRIVRRSVTIICA